MKVQPADKSYFFDKCYRDVGYVMATTWTKAFSPIANEAKRLGRMYRRNVAAALFMMLCDMVVFPVIAIVMLALNSVFSVLFLAFFAVATVVMAFLFVLVWFFDTLFCLLHGIGSHCPTCQKKFMLPTYVCPQCGARHTVLRPGVYGILKRRCDCGKKIPTTFFNGRQKLKAVCPQCGTDIKDGGRHREIAIPVVGGPSSGKSCYINMAITQIEREAAQNGLRFRYSPTTGDDYEANKLAMRRGQLPEKTYETRMRYYQFYLTPQGDKMENLISLCDVAGEAYEQNSEIGKQIGYKYANAFLMIFDPLSIPAFRDEMRAKVTNFNRYGASVREMDEVLSVLISTLENMNCLNSKNMLKTDVAVVLSKCDIPGLRDRLGPDAVRRYMQTNNISDKYEAQNRVCEEFLRKYGAANFLNNLQSKFRSVQFFACSALGHVENGAGFVSDGVAEPALWLIDKASASIDLKKKWGKKI